MNKFLEKIGPAHILTTITLLMTGLFVVADMQTDIAVLESKERDNKVFQQRVYKELLSIRQHQLRSTE